MVRQSKRRPGTNDKISRYDIADTEMAAGSTFGSPKATMIIKATGAIEKIYSGDIGLEMFGTVLVNHWDDRTGTPLSAMPGTYRIHPEHHEHLFHLTNGIRVREDIFVLSGQPKGATVDPPACYYAIELYNDTQDPIEISTYAFTQLRGNTPRGIASAYTRKHRAIVAWNQTQEELARIVGASVEPTSYEVLAGNGRENAPLSPGMLGDTTIESDGDPVAAFHFVHRLKAGEYARFELILSFSNRGRAGALRTYARCPSAATALERTRRHYENVLNRTVVICPDENVNRGVLWAKANMLRTQTLSPTGWCFVNDPTRSNNSVGRDTAWFAYGADYITPEFSRNSLLWYAEHLEKSGMVVEYYDIRSGKTADYDLNINDNTPLLILALWHHYNASGDLSFLKRIYPPARKAARYILSQRNARGLIWCNASGTSDWGIVGWRNVIPNYRLSGATTEVNSECYAALQTVSHMARVLGKHADGAFFKGAAEALREAINAHLLDSESHLYYLNIELDGTKRSDCTSDMVFPLMFGVADDETAARIIARLSREEFWTAAGIRTVPRTAVNYGPIHGYGLLGGVWIGASFWYAFAAARFNPALMARSLSAAFKHYSTDPRRNNTVPGQFSEWLHGETLVNQGMMLSPWLPPRYLWAAIEGAAGLDISGDTPSINPRLAPDWKWMGVSNLPFRGKNLTWFVVRLPDLQMYGNVYFDRSIPCIEYDTDESSHVKTIGDAVSSIALRKGNNIVLFMGNTSEHTISTAVTLDLPLSGSYSAKTFNSLRGAWVDGEEADRNALRRGIPVELDGKGFCVIELRQEV
jgi:glycogen debranching enzyme